MTTLLIADDDEDIRYVLDRVFTKAGFDVQLASDGLTAIRLAASTRPDVVLTDLDMPGMGGFELCQAIRADHDLRDVPVVILSGSVRLDDPRATEARACRVLQKPIGNKDLIAEIRRLVDGGRHDHSAASGCPSGG